MDNDKRTTTIAITLSEAEKNEIKKQAKNAHTTMSNFVRQELLYKQK